MEHFLEIAFHATLDLIQVERFSFAYKKVEPPTGDFVKTYGFSLEPEYIHIDANNGVIGHILKTGKPLLITNTEEVDLKFLYPEIISVNHLSQFQFISMMKSLSIKCI